MKKVIVVSKTHLDLGFTDYAENIRQKYINTFIPSAIALAENINTESDKKFIWTTGSWILKEALANGTDAQKEALIKALKDGISYVLYDNVWGTNFPLWYEDNARFDFVIAPEKEETL